MSQVFLAIPKAPDQLLGHVHDDGTIYRSKPGPDVRVGKVDLATGKVFAERFGPDQEVGHVDLKSGKVYLSRMGPDEYAGSVDDQGRMYWHMPLASDAYIGKVDHFLSYAHSAGAMLLLVLPAVEEEGTGAGGDQEEDAADR